MDKIKYDSEISCEKNKNVKHCFIENESVANNTTNSNKQEEEILEKNVELVIKKRKKQPIDEPIKISGAKKKRRIKGKMTEEASILRRINIGKKILQDPIIYLQGVQKIKDWKTNFHVLIPCSNQILR